MGGDRKNNGRYAIMAYVITDTCTKDELCVEACPTDCIHPKKDEEGFEAATQLYVDPDGCIDCGACVPVCPTNSIFVVGRGSGRQAGIHRQERRALRHRIAVVGTGGAEVSWPCVKPWCLLSALRCCDSGADPGAIANPRENKGTATTVPFSFCGSSCASTRALSIRIPHPCAYDRIDVWC